MFTAVLFCENLISELERTLTSLAANASCVQRIYMVGTVSEEVRIPPALSDKILREHSFRDLSRRLTKETQSEYYLFWEAGASLKKNALADGEKQARSAEKFFRDILRFEPSDLRTVRYVGNGGGGCVNLAQDPSIPLGLDYIALHRSLVEKYPYPFEGVSWDQRNLWFISMLEGARGVLKLKGNILEHVPPQAGETMFAPAREREWYTPLLETLYREFLSEQGELCATAQYNLAFAISSRFHQNLNARNHNVFDSDGERLHFEAVCRELLQKVSPEILADPCRYKGLTEPDALRLHMLRVRQGGEAQVVCMEDENGVPCLTFCGCRLKSLSQQKLRIDTMNFEDGAMVLELSIGKLLPDEDYDILCDLDKKALPMEEKIHYQLTTCFGVPIFDRRNYLVRVPFATLKKSRHQLTFAIRLNGQEILLPMETGRFGSRISADYPHAYCRKDGQMLFFGSEKRSLIVEPAKAGKIFRREIKVLKEVFQRSKRVFVYRAAYWLTRPWLRRKNIWITFDKLYKAGDNGEYFFRYARNNQDGIEVKYIINKAYDDAKRLKEEGLDPLYYRSLRQILYFLNSRVIATTHANVPVFSGIHTGGFKYVQDLLDADIVCIQHGLAVQWLPHNLNAQYDNLKRFYCASPYEVKNLSHPLYGYHDPEKSLRLTGVARYDGLVNQPKKQILIIPTWRSYISMPASAGGVRPYSPDFKETDYFKIYNSLIQNPRLIETAKRLGYQVKYLLHPTVTSQIGDYTPGENVEVLSPLGVSYEKILTESDLMVTDYSGVQFDFAYMRKPILYYHPDALPPHYVDGGFFYDTMGFGEIIKTEKRLVDELCRLMENGCQLDEFYRGRADAFFAFDDRNNAKRIYEDLKEMSGAQ